MTFLFKRISDLVSANINDLIDRVEDPERMIKQIIREMEANLGAAREGVVDAVASEKQLAKEYQRHLCEAEQWRRRADNEALAREALARRQEHQQIAQSMQCSVEAAAKTTTRLKAQLRALEAKLDEARRKKGSLIARKRAVQAHDRLDDTLAVVDRAHDINLSFTRMEDRVTEMEARTEAREEVLRPGDDLERAFRTMQSSTEVESELAALKDAIADSPRTGEATGC